MVRMEDGTLSYVSELAQSKFAQGSDDLSTNFVGNVELHHAHIRRAERGILFGSHGDADEAPRLVGRVESELLVELKGSLVVVSLSMPRSCA